METEERHPEDIIRVQDHVYVLANSALVEQRTRVLKHGDCFGVFDVYGDLQPIGLGSQGLFLGATRFLSTYEMRLNGHRLPLLSSTIQNDNTHFVVDLMNPGFRDMEGRGVAQGSLHVLRSKFLWNDVCYEQIALENFLSSPVTAKVSLHFQSDFADIFEVRGMRRARRGKMEQSRTGNRSVFLAYEGLDGVRRRSKLFFRPEPDFLTDAHSDFIVPLGPKQRKTIHVTISCEVEKVPPRERFQRAKKQAIGFLQSSRRQDLTIKSSNSAFNQWIERSQTDLHLMVTQTDHGPYPYAGVPWFNTVFGRDGIITALQSLWINPAVAKGVLAYLGARQSKEDSPSQDANPGKILHEVRTGEMVAMGDVPFKQYYGTADATPLFVILAAEYLERTGDSAFLKSIWENVRDAVEWIDRYGDLDGDGFVEYSRRAPKGLTNQGWKDSGDCISHTDGKLAEGPIALCEIQAYAYAAKRSGARVAAALGHRDQAQVWAQSAEKLKAQFDEKFWSDKLSTYGLALDGAKRLCEVRASNAGHCLFAGIVPTDRARNVATSLMQPDLFSGWGIRTLSSLERNYNPMSYHNGSVWPHDTAIIAEGFARYGFKDLALKLFNGLFDASAYMDLHRLPELFCGFDRRVGEGPTLYPVACSPQAWAAGSVFMVLKACLGLTIHSFPAQVHFHYPVLPKSLDWLQIQGLRIGEAEVDLLLNRHRGDVSLNILRRDGDIEVATIK